MSALLLDVNVLVALFDPAHLHHEAAHKWFARRGKASWATCPLTINGCLRVLFRIAAITAPTPVSNIADQLRDFLMLPGRIDFSSQLELTDTEQFDLTKLRGPNQLTNAVLLAIAVQNRAKLLTFDRNIPWQAVRAASRESIHLLSA